MTVSTDRHVRLDDGRQFRVRFHSVSTTDGTAIADLAPGQSIVFAEDPADSGVSSGSEPVATLNADLPGLKSAFENAWFPSGRPVELPVRHYGGKGVGLCTGGDGVTLFDACGNVIDEVSFGAAPADHATFVNPTLVGVGGSASESAAPALTTLSVAGIGGAQTDATGETGSPGINPPVAITEIDPAGSSAAYQADWFELTNSSPLAIDLSGWTMDDNSDALANSVSTTEGSASPILQPGESIVFAEDPADSSVSSGSESVATLTADLPGLETAFEDAWFPGGTAPSNFRFGTYGGKGVGLSTGGDAVNLFNSAATPVVGVTFTAAPPGGATFDNSTGTLPASVRGVNGARPSQDGTELARSPGTIAPDTTAPTLTVLGNQGTYAFTDTVDITCSATDDVFGSGIQTDCTGIDASPPRHSFGAGTQRVTLSASDFAGNAGTTQVTFPPCRLRRAPVVAPAQRWRAPGGGAARWWRAQRWRARRWRARRWRARWWRAPAAARPAAAPPPARAGALPRRSSGPLGASTTEAQDRERRGHNGDEGQPAQVDGHAHNPCGNKTLATFKRTRLARAEK